MGHAPQLPLGERRNAVHRFELENLKLQVMGKQGQVEELCDASPGQPPLARDGARVGRHSPLDGGVEVVGQDNLARCVGALALTDAAIECRLLE